MISFLILLIDLLILGSSFAVVSWLVNGSVEIYSYQSSLGPFVAAWIVFSLLNRKYAFVPSKYLEEDIKAILFSNFCVVAFGSLLVFLFKYEGVSRLVILVTPVIATFLEIVIAGVIKKSRWRILSREIYPSGRFQKSDYSFAIYDLLIWVVSYLSVFLVFYFNGGIPERLLVAYTYLLLYSSVVSYIASVVTRKLQLKGKVSYSDFLIPVVNSSGIILISLAVAVVALKGYDISRLMVGCSVAVAFAVDIFIVSILFNNRLSAVPSDNEELHLLAFQAVLCKVREVEEIHEPRSFSYQNQEGETVYSRLGKDLSDDEIEFISLNIDLKQAPSSIPLMIYSGPPGKLLECDDESLEIFINRLPVNSLENTAEHFRNVHRKLKDGGYFIGSASTSDVSAEKHRKKYSGPVHAILAGLNFLVEDLLIRTAGVRWFAGLFGIEIRQSLSRTEVLGRLVVCGFKNVDFTLIKDRLYFIAYKSGEPKENNEQLYSAFINLRRLGKFGRDIRVYKFRTMYPYSEYLRDFAIKKCGYTDTGDGVGKIEDDFRITGIGRIMRRYWLDELPQLLNILRGEIKLVGVRPLEINCLKTYPVEFLKRRLKYKPGLLAPYAAHIHKNMDEYVEAEIKYLDEYDRQPFLTDCKYFFWILWNILSGKVKSS